MIDDDEIQILARNNAGKLRNLAFAEQGCRLGIVDPHHAGMDDIEVDRRTEPDGLVKPRFRAAVGSEICLGVFERSWMIGSRIIARKRWGRRSTPVSFCLSSVSDPVPRNHWISKSRLRET
jgi:hypothetical protein